MGERHQERTLHCIIGGGGGGEGIRSGYILPYSVGASEEDLTVYYWVGGREASGGGIFYLTV